MNLLTIFLLGVINGIIIDNVILSRFFGICPFLGVSKKTNHAVNMGICVTIVLIISSLITRPIYYHILVKANIEFMDTITYILIISSLVQLMEILIKKFSPALYKNLGVYLPLITTNCCILGVSQTNTDNNLSFIDSLSNAIGTSLGFLLVITIFSFIRVRLESSNVPKCLKGVPISLITASIMGLAFMGFVGLIK